MSFNEKEKLAKSSFTSKDILRELSTDEDQDIKEWVGYNPNTPVDILQALAKDKSMHIRKYVASNPSTPEDVLRELATDVNWNVRFYVAENSKASDKLLVRILDYEKSLTNPDSDVIRSLYANPKLPYIAKVIIETLFGSRL